jgi:NAD(P)-dependent dehydrogenase (short-subunit alcohol dehydrogenase family)
LRKRVCVIDGQGGGIGAALIRALKEAYGETLELLALGTNAVATLQMMKAGANRGATGENSIVRTVETADVILGPVSVTWGNAMLGEVTPRMAEAITSASAPKILLPLFQERILLVGLNREPLPHLVEMIVKEKLKEVLSDV